MLRILAWLGSLVGTLAVFGKAHAYVFTNNAAYTRFCWIQQPLFLEFRRSREGRDAPEFCHGSYTLLGL